MNTAQSNSVPSYGTIGENAYMLDPDYVGHLCVLIVCLCYVFSYFFIVLVLKSEIKFELN